MNDITWKAFMGCIALESRMRSEGNKLIGEGRALHYDGNGTLIKDTGWEPTGVVAILREPEPRRWWDFWK